MNTKEAVSAIFGDNEKISPLWKASPLSANVNGPMCPVCKRRWPNDATKCEFHPEKQLITLENI